MITTLSQPSGTQMMDQLDNPSDFFGGLKRKYMMAKKIFLSLYDNYIKKDSLSRDVEAIESQNLLSHRINMVNPYDDNKEIILKGFRNSVEKYDASLDSILYVNFN